MVIWSGCCKWFRWKCSGPSNNIDDIQSQIQSGIQAAQQNFDTLVEGVFDEMLKLQKIEYTYTKEAFNVAVNSSIVSLGGGIEINFELLMFYGLIIVLLMMKEILM